MKAWLNKKAKQWQNLGDDDHQDQGKSSVVLIVTGWWHIDVINSIAGRDGICYTYIRSHLSTITVIIIIIAITNR